MSKLTEEDYDFSGVQRSELDSCLHYEYMRESEAIIQEVKNLARQIRKKSQRRSGASKTLVGQQFNITKITHHPGIHFEAIMFLRLARSGKFPTVPWQKLSSSEKQRLSDFLGNARRCERKHWLEAYPPLVMATPSKDALQSTLRDWITKQRQQYREVPRTEAEKFLESAPKEFFLSGSALTKLFVTGFFQINLNYSRSQLLDAFGEWLKANYPREQKELAARRGRTAVRDGLNALGALRLRYHCKTFSEAKAIMKRIKGGEKSARMFYADRKSFNRACKAAVRHFHKSLELSTDHKPIRFTKGWQK